ncbi:MAG: Nif3-like dinuclear metal center hexameric protein [Bacteroidales bacterium]|nr:Nif3-like dinuclear metal center hexameric protein [Bacteroidales bacterium]MDD3960230.1 Nif3-like dinuclear metal center hexameric protein [Bacteroidales bacterium]MDY0286187.1 Nif3-like dinuclear metal center hexameric protein [Bacteroidales bacterium]HPE86430.1 Nif3-like dinuclear metal center hexameric protein [Bacteroidales bacterium]
MKHAQIFGILEQVAPPAYQESYDNAGIITGSYDTECTGAIITLDVTEAVVQEALSHKANLIIAHHPLIFNPLKKIIPGNAVTNPLIEAIKHDITIYAIHTNLDNVATGVNHKLCSVLGIKNPEILAPGNGKLSKLVTFVPPSHANKVREALFAAGAGDIGNYDLCSFNSQGEGTFRAKKNTHPFSGKIGEMHSGPEVRIETIFPAYLSQKITKALKTTHPYEEVAYDICSIDNYHPAVGAGMIGDLDHPISWRNFLDTVKEKLHIPCIRHTGITDHKVKRVAVCGGAGSFLITKARKANADLFLTGDIKYHEFFDGGKQLILADIGHYESEQFTKDLLFEILNEKFPTFALSISKTNTNPVKYL